MKWITLWLLLSARPASAGYCADQVTAGYPHSVAIVQDDLDYMRIADLLPVERRAEVRGYIAFTKHALEVRARDQKLAGWADPLLQNEASRLLAHMRDVVGQWKVDDTVLVNQDRTLYRQRAERTLLTYRVLTRNLGFMLREGRAIRWGTLFRFTWLTAILEDDARSDYGIGSSWRPPSLASYFKFDVAAAHDEIRDYAQRVIGDDEAGGVAIVDGLVAEAERLFAEQGKITVPVARLPGEYERLALGFLPLHWLPAVPTEGRTVLDHYLDLSLHVFGYDSKGLRSTQPLDWTVAINAAWKTWFALLGGGEARSHSGALYVVLFTLRYGTVDGMMPDWSQPGPLLRFLIHEVAFIERSYLNLNVLDHFAARPDHLPTISDGDPLYGLDHRQVTGALDALVGRLSPLGLVKLGDPSLLEFIARHRGRVVTDIYDVLALTPN